jgi:subtilisin family serine protease
MKQILLTLLSCFLLTGIANTQDFANPHYMDPYNPEYEPNEILVKFKDEVEVVPLKSANGTVETGIRSFDKFSVANRVVGMEKIFKAATRLKSAKTITINGETKEAPRLYNIYKLKLESNTDAKTLAEELQAEAEVEYAEPNYFVYSQSQFDNTDFEDENTESKKDNTQINKTQSTAAPNDPLYSEQWYLQAINAEGAWAKEPTGGAGQVIAILDTGVDYLHPDLDDNIWQNQAELNGAEGVDDDGNGFVDDIMGWDWVNNDNDPKDDNSHGTHVAGIAAAEQNNGTGISGVAFGSKIMPLKVLQSSGRGNSGDLAAAITYAAENGATVINMSLGSYGESLVVKAALENAYSTALPVAAAGNEGYAIEINDCKDVIAVQYPAAYNFVFGVQATGQITSSNCYDNILADFSNYDSNGPASENVNYEGKAPGTNIYSTFPNGNYKNLNGTSMATPIVAGTIAIMNKYESQSHEEIFAKLIQSTGNTIDANSVIDYSIEPDLQFISYTIGDNFNGGDGDGIADAGEIIEIWFKVKNLGGFADSVYANLSLVEFEDPSVANITKSTQYIGDISAYASLTGELDSFMVEINPTLANNRDIIFVYELGCNNSGLLKSGQIIITIQNGVEIAGLFDGLMILEPSKEYIVTGNCVFDSLIIRPGTTIKMNNSVTITVNSYLKADGTKDSLITFTQNDSEDYWQAINYYGDEETLFRYCLFEYSGNYGLLFFIESKIRVEDCIFKNLKNKTITCWDVTTFKRNLFYNNNTFYFRHVYGNDKINSHNIFTNNFYSTIGVGDLNEYQGLNTFRNNISFKNYDSSEKRFSFMCSGSWGIHKFSPQYFGCIDSAKIENSVIDYFEDSELPVLSAYDSAMIEPSVFCHGLVWKIEINDKLINIYDNPYNLETGLGIIGDETLKFDVYFNRAMDTIYTPLLTFGVREPYTQHIVANNATWNEDSTIYTAYYTVTAKTGDGIQRVRVANARDDELFEIPIEDSRFEFIVQAAGAASLNFQATPGIGKVDLEWPASNTDDALGYNIYRCYMITDSTTSDTVLINTELVIDTTFLDTNVIPDTTYKYLYKTVGTDMQETDYSKAVTAKPFNAANGDANGDLSVNVSDIVTIVNYILENNPKPFLHDAADVNYDGVINVLDIVALVNIIMVPESQVKTAFAGNAQISIEDGMVYVDSPVELGGIQFTLADVSAEQEVEILEALNGFEVVRSMKDGKLTILAYSLSGSTIKAGKSALLKLNDKNSWIFEAILSDTKGSEVKYSLNGTATVTAPLKLNAGFTLGQNYPNPFTGKTAIPFELEMNVDEAEISVFDIMGRKVKTWKLENLNRGEHKVEWSGEGQSGVYLYKMYVKQNGHRSYTKTKRMIVK